MTHVEWRQQNRWWIGSTKHPNPFRTGRYVDKVLVGLCVEDPEDYERIEMVNPVCDLKPHVDKDGRLHFWEPFRLVMDVTTQYHQLVVWFLPKTQRTDPPQLHLEWDDIQPHEKSMARHAIVSEPVFIYNHPNWLSEEEVADREDWVKRKYPYYPKRANNIFQRTAGMFRMKYSVFQHDEKFKR